MSDEETREQVRLLKHYEVRKAVVAGDERTVRILLEALGTERTIIVNMSPNDIDTLLFLAAAAGFDNITKHLIAAGADGRVHPVTKYSPLFSAVHNGFYSTSKILLEHFPHLAQQATVEGWLPLHAACISGHKELVELLINYPSYPRHLYTKYTDEEQIWEYELPFDPNAQDATGRTCLYIASILGNDVLINVLLKWRVKCSKIQSSCLSTPSSMSDSGIVTPTRRNISFGIQAIMSKLNISMDNEQSSKDENQRDLCPINVNLLCGAACETSLLGAVRGGFLSVVNILLKNNANPNICAKPVENPSNPACCEEIYGLSSIPIAEACKQGCLEIVKVLLEHGAKDERGQALGIAVAAQDEKLLNILLCKRAHRDFDYKINKKALPEPVEVNCFQPSATNISYSSMYPNIPTIIDWHSNNSSVQLRFIKFEWMINAVLQLNPNLQGHPKINEISPMAITRIDLSHNGLTSLPLEIFNLVSLKYLNVAQNKIAELPEPNADNLTYKCPVLEEIFLQDNRLVNLNAQIFHLPALLILDLSNNKLQDLPSDLWKAPKLRELNVAFNLLKTLPNPISQPLGMSNSCNRQSTDSNRHSFGEDDYNKRACDLNSQSLKHCNIWSNCIDIADNHIDWSDKKEEGVSQLSYLNIANNMFTSIPVALPCLAVSLTRLNMSYNSLRSMGYVTSYPATLKQLDLSHNEISCWPSLPRITNSDPHLLCYNCGEQSAHFDNETGIFSKPPSGKKVSTFRSNVLKNVCIHRRHLRLESLRTLILADNLLTRIQLSTDDVTVFNDSEDSDWTVLGITKSRLIFPNLSMLDISNNCLKEIPSSLQELTGLSVLNISGNINITDLPPQLGLLSRLWSLNTRGCLLQDPLRSMIESKKYKTMDIIGYLKSIYEDAQPYARMKLMVVGVQGIGKTTLLSLLSHKTHSHRSSSLENHWTKRMGNSVKNSPKQQQRAENISTVGVDIGTWVCDKPKKIAGSYGPVTFRTWDFGGQKEYYATHQYFLTKRSLYLVLWKITDGQKGLAEIIQWLGNIQARAPNSPVIIVGTHYDLVGDTFDVKEALKLQQIIREKYIAIPDAEKIGLPRVIDSIEISCRTLHNVSLLANIVYDTAFTLRSPGSKTPLLLQKVPASYIALEDVVNSITSQLRHSGRDPVLNAEHYRKLVTEEMRLHNYRKFRDIYELNQATMFLHDNGVILHYDDATLRDYYFLDPQWLCDMLAHVVTVREINPFARDGIMRLEDLNLLFHNSNADNVNNRDYIISLLNKFEVALTWDARTLLIPSLLPETEANPGNAGTSIKISQKTRTRFNHLMSQSLHEITQKPMSYEYRKLMDATGHLKIHRLLLMTYFPSGFWSRLITRLLGDTQIGNAVKEYYMPLSEEGIDYDLKSSLEQNIQWCLWQTGLALYHGTVLMLKICEVSHETNRSTQIFRNENHHFKLKLDGFWNSINLTTSNILHIYIPLHNVQLIKNACETDSINSTDTATFSDVIRPSKLIVARLLALIVDHIDLLLEDWYPSLGTRFVHTSEGRFLITRVVPCNKCLDKLKAIAEVSITGDTIKPLSCYGWMVEECILSNYNQTKVLCPVHSELNILDLTPDVVFADIPAQFTINPENIIKGALLGRGAFGFVFKATCKLKDSRFFKSVAMKMLQPVPPGPRANESALMAYKVALGKWDRDPLQHACKAYCTARQELGVLLTLKHPNIVSFVGICTKPLAIVLELAPLGSLDTKLRQYRRSGAHIVPTTFQLLALQAARAVEYLHRRRIIYRDLKAENVLVWSFPEPNSDDTTNAKVHIKIADYGISRQTAPSGAKGFGGTEGFMAPEIIRFNGEEEYTEKVDCFSFGMFIYEIISLRQPFEGHESIKESILDGSRPSIGIKETHFPSYCLDLMALCWNELPKKRPSASQIVSILTAPEFIHLLDVVALPHTENVICGLYNSSNLREDDNLEIELWLPAYNSRIDCLTVNSYGHVLHSCNIICTDSPHNELKAIDIPKNSKESSTKKPTQTIAKIISLNMLCCCSVNENIWIGDAMGNIHAYCARNYKHIFTYILDPAIKSPVISLIYLESIKRVSVGMQNGRVFLVDSTRIPSKSAFAEGSFVLTEIRSGSILLSACAITMDSYYELWCGDSGGKINVFTLNANGVCGHQAITHNEDLNSVEDLKVARMCATGAFVFTTLSPGFIIYQWNVKTKNMNNKLDCSKLLPCSESIKSIAIEEHWSWIKCQVSALCINNSELYIGTTWGCLIIAEVDTLRPITVFRPYENEIKHIIALPHAQVPLIATVGRRYRSLITRFMNEDDNEDTKPNELKKTRDQDVHNNVHCIIWRAKNWA